MHDCMIIGTGPAGMTAALYLLRAGKSVLILEKESIGGQIAKSPRLENYPSIHTISGEVFADRLFNQIQELGVEFEFGDANGIEKKEDGTFLVKTDYGEYEAKTVILATGCSHRCLGLDREEELIGHGLSYCATCDGAFFKDKEVLLIGDANTALQYAIVLAETSSKVTIATLFDRFFGDDILIKRVVNNPKIEIFHNLSAVEYLGDSEISGVKFVDTKTKEEKIIPCSGCFVAIGQIPSNEPFASLVDLEKGFIVTDESMQTKTKGLYAIGDCRAKQVRQVVTAVGDGGIAAVNATNYLNSL